MNARMLAAAVLLLAAASPSMAMLNPTMGRFMQRDPVGYVDGMNTYSAYHVMRGGVDPSGMARKSEIGTNLFYTCKGGWIDKKHTQMLSGGILWRVRKAGTGHSFTRSANRHGFKLRARTKSTLAGTHIQNYFVADDLGGESAESVAYGIFRDFVWSHEVAQGGALNWLAKQFGAGSSFSEEDLPSHVLGFHMEVAGLGKSDFGNVLKKLHVVSDANAEKIWEEGGQIVEKRSWGPAYKDTPTSKACCKGVQREFPLVLPQEVTPAGLGRGWDRWKFKTFIADEWPPKSPPVVPAGYDGASYLPAPGALGENFHGP